jgi:hypothetical protein
MKYPDPAKFGNKITKFVPVGKKMSRNGLTAWDSLPNHVQEKGHSMTRIVVVT